MSEQDTETLEEVNDCLQQCKVNIKEICEDLERAIKLLHSANGMSVPLEAEKWRAETLLNNLEVEAKHYLERYQEAQNE